MKEVDEIMFNFDAKFNEHILKGIVTGYKDYIKVKNHANSTMEISDAYAYVKANHIDDQVAKHVSKFAEASRQNAGPSWKYLMFQLNDESTTTGFKFILKNELYFNANNVTEGKKLIEDKKSVRYLEELIKNNKDVNFGKIENEFKVEHQISGESLLFNQPHDNHDKNNNEIKFIIITYGIDYSSKMLNAVKIWAPNPLNKKAVLLRDLTMELNELIKYDEDYALENEELKVLQNDEEEKYVDPTFAFGILPNENNDIDIDKSVN